MYAWSISVKRVRIEIHNKLALLNFHSDQLNTCICIFCQFMILLSRRLWFPLFSLTYCSCHNLETTRDGTLTLLMLCHLSFMYIVLLSTTDICSSTSDFLVIPEDRQWTKILKQTCIAYHFSELWLWSIIQERCVNFWKKFGVNAFLSFSVKHKWIF